MQTPIISRRGFLASASLAATAAWLAPRSVFAHDSGDEGGIVGMIRKEAATGPITVQSLRGNVHVLMGSGGNIAVFSGQDGKLLVDAGIPASRHKIIEALAAISPAPDQSPYQYPLALRSHRWQCLASRGWRDHSRP